MNSNANYFKDHIYTTRTTVILIIIGITNSLTIDKNTDHFGQLNHKY